MKGIWQLGRFGIQIGGSGFLKVLYASVLFFFLVSVALADTWYVRADLESSGDGTSWATAYATIMEAVTATGAGDEIWVQGGTYQPTWIYFSGKQNVSIYGGFSGMETALSQRDLTANATILNGELATSNGVLVIYSDATDITIDGLTITNYSGTSAAMRVSGNAVIRNCNFFNNTTTSGLNSGSTSGYYGGAAMTTSSGNQVIINCVFAHNTAPYGYGGAVNLHSGSADFINCTFTGNQAIKGGAIGIYNDGGPNHEIYNCLFWGNIGTTSIPDVFVFDYSNYGPISSHNHYSNYANPLLVDPDTGNYHISPGSPCIDAGTGSVTLASVDMDGDDRVIDGDSNGSLVVDIGADEFDPTQQYYADLYVDSTKSDDTGDGTTWATAKATIQAAIDAAAAGNEIWVRTGTYAPIAIDKAVSIYGGFVGNEIQRLRRNPVAYPTIIDGNNSARCVDLSAASVIDGFLITKGNSNGGGGVLIGDSGATISNCKIDGNVSSGFGGGVYFSSHATIENCEITNNEANTGGGIYNGFVSSTIDSCIIQGNTASNGGGIFNDGGMAPRITNCLIKDNYASNNGGGICNDEKNDAIISGCTIILNTATSRGGGIYSGQDSSSNTTYAEPEITNNVIANNWATWGGGLYCAAYSKPEIINCTIAGNTAATGGAGVYVYAGYSYTRIMNSILYGNVLDGGGHSDIYFEPTYYPGSVDDNLILLYNNFSMLNESWHNSGAPTRTGNIAVYCQL